MGCFIFTFNTAAQDALWIRILTSFFWGFLAAGFCFPRCSYSHPFSPSVLSHSPPPSTNLIVSMGLVHTRGTSTVAALFRDRTRFIYVECIARFFVLLFWFGDLNNASFLCFSFFARGCCSAFSFFSTFACTFLALSVTFPVYFYCLRVRARCVFLAISPH